MTFGQRCAVYIIELVGGRREESVKMVIRKSGISLKLKLLLVPPGFG